MVHRQPTNWIKRFEFSPSIKLVQEQILIRQCAANRAQSRFGCHRVPAAVEQKSTAAACTTAKTDHFHAHCALDERTLFVEKEQKNDLHIDDG